ncbi:MAG TPA: hypothetical protein VHY08_01870 [Bacillota bacterium]|nr:hypothetical protein [Bacillota bacterium]
MAANINSFVFEAIGLTIALVIELPDKEFNLNPASNLKNYQNKDLPDSADEPDPANFPCSLRKI